jgi:hypothetical protein
VFIDETCPWDGGNILGGAYEMLESIGTTGDKAWEGDLCRPFLLALERLRFISLSLEVDR